LAFPLTTHDELQKINKNEMKMHKNLPDSFTTL